MGSWGLRAFFAGLIYEALEWRFKCTATADSYCRAFSWLEVVYIILQVAAGNAILLAVVFSSQVCFPCFIELRGAATRLLSFPDTQSSSWSVWSRVQPVHAGFVARVCTNTHRYLTVHWIEAGVEVSEKYLDAGSSSCRSSTRFVSGDLAGEMP